MLEIWVSRLKKRLFYNKIEYGDSMKRIKRKELILLFVVTVLLTGCGNKLKCEIDGLVEGRKYTSTVVVKFKDEKPSTYSFKDKMMFDPEDPNAEIYYHSKYDEYSTLLSEKKARISNNTDNISFKVKYDFEEDHSSQENKILIGRDDSREIAKNKLENVGYRCK